MELHFSKEDTEEMLHFSQNNDSLLIGHLLEVIPNIIPCLRQVLAQIKNLNVFGNVQKIIECSGSGHNLVSI